MQKANRPTHHEQGDFNTIYYYVRKKHTQLL